ncbi:efflux RND transporter periplasmic adaptor subunit, partial [Escherichia coli]
MAVPTPEIPLVKEGAKVSMVGNGDDTPRHADGQVVFVGPVLNQATRTARVIAAFNNPDLAWRPGTFVNAEIESRTRPPQLLVPRGAVQKINGIPK